MILHTGDCQEIQVEHTPGTEANPIVWRFAKHDFGEVPAEHPVTGWRYVTIHTFHEYVVWWDYFNTKPAPFDGLPTAPRAECSKRMIGTSAAPDYNFLDHEPGAPDPHCQCGYRIVHDIADIAPYLRWMNTDADPYPASQLPDELREKIGATLNDTIDVSVALVSVLGSGNTAACDFKTYIDPQNTLRVEWVAATPTIIVTTGSAALQALRAFGADVTTVDNLDQVHEPDRCNDTTPYALWKLHPAPNPTAEDIALHDGTDSLTGDGWTLAGRWGIHGAAGIAITHDDQILLVRSGNHWQLPGGALNAGETPGECVVREALEEIQTDITRLEVTGAFAHTDAAGWTYTTITANGHVHATPGAEVSDVGWFSSPPVGCHPDLEAVWGRLTTRS